jgi:hypothetical protein
LCGLTEVERLRQGNLDLVALNEVIRRDHSDIHVCDCAILL